MFAPALTLVSVSARTRMPASPWAPRAPPGGLGISAPPTAPPRFPRAGGLGGSRQPAPRGLGCGWAPSSAGGGWEAGRSPASGFRKGFAFSGRWGRPPRPAAVPGFRLAPDCGRGRSAGNVSRPSGWLLPLAPWAAAPSREGEAEMKKLLSQPARARPEEVP